MTWRGHGERVLSGPVESVHRICNGWFSGTAYSLRLFVLATLWMTCARIVLLFSKKLAV
jgi:hypothetical protein